MPMISSNRYNRQGARTGVLPFDLLLRVRPFRLFRKKFLCPFQDVTDFTDVTIVNPTGQVYIRNRLNKEKRLKLK